MKYKSLLSSIILFSLLLLANSPVKAAPSNNPIFASIQFVQNAINTALSPVQTSVNGLNTRVNNLELTVTPIPGQIAGIQSHLNQVDHTLASQAAQITSLQPGKTFKVYDANSQELGILLQSDFVDHYQVYIPSVNKVAEITDDTIENIVLEYTTDDCSGTVYSSFSGNLAPSNKVFSIQDGSFYTIDKNEVKALRVMRSDKEWHSNTKSFSCYSFGFDSLTNSVPVVPITLPFTQPFALPLQFKYQ